MFSRVQKNLITLCEYHSVALAALPIAFYAANLFRMMSDYSIPYMIVMFLAGGAGFLVLLYNQIKCRNMILVILTTAIFVLFAVINMLLVGNADIGSIATEVMMFGITYLLLFCKPSIPTSAVFFVVVASVIACFWTADVNPNIILSSSTNYLSVILILTVSLLYIALERDQKHKQINTLWQIMPAIACFALSVWAGGRSGILACGILMVGVFGLYLLFGNRPRMFYVWLKRSLRRKELKGILLCAVLAFCVLLMLVLITLNADFFLSKLGKFGTRGFDNSARESIWGAYFSACFSSVKNIMLGARRASIPLVVEFNSNLHNSFLHLHAEHGLLVFSLFFVLMLYAGIYYLKKRMFVHLLLIFVIFVRGFFDKFIFMQYGMPIMMYLVLYPLVYRDLSGETKPD